MEIIYYYYYINLFILLIYRDYADIVTRYLSDNLAYLSLGYKKNIFKLNVVGCLFNDITTIETIG
jgi:hypothetical protein